MWQLSLPLEMGTWQHFVMRLGLMGKILRTLLHPYCHLKAEKCHGDQKYAPRLLDQKS
jgi:hypothetical protein